jgi:hypothetical protein
MSIQQYEINNHLKDSYISISVESGGLIEYQYRLQNKFQIPCFLRLSSVYENQEQLHYYHINDMDSLIFCLKEHTFGYQIIVKLVQNLLEALESCEAYMLDEDRLDLRFEFIYYHRVEKVFYFLYRPSVEFTKSVKEQVFDLFDYLIKIVNPADYKAINLTHRLRIAIENERLNSSEILLILEDVETMDTGHHIRVQPKQREVIKERASIWKKIGLKLFGKDMRCETH